MHALAEMDGMGWDGMGWDGMGWDEFHDCVLSGACISWSLIRRRTLDVGMDSVGGVYTLLFE